MASLFSRLSKKPKPKQIETTQASRWRSEFVDPARQIQQSDTFQYGAGMTTVASLMQSGKRVGRSRQQIYEKWAEMEGDPVVSSALKLQVTSALGGHETSGNTVFIEKSPTINNDSRKQALVEEIAADLAGMLNRLAYSIAYTATVFGDSYARIYVDKRGVIDLCVDEMVRPPLVQPFMRGSRTVGYALYLGERNFERMDVSQIARMRMPRSQWVPQYGVFEKSLKIKIADDDMGDIPIMPDMVGGSVLYNAEPAYDNMIAAIMGLVGQRWMDSIDEQILTLQMEGMTEEQQARMSEQVIAMIKGTKARTEKAVQEGRPILERIRHIIPVFSEKQLLQVSNAGYGASGRGGTVQVDDVLFHAKMLAGAIGTDLSMLGFSDQLSGGLGEGGFFRMSAQAAENARSIRSALSDFFHHIIDIHCLNRYGVVFDPADRPYLVNFYGSISALEAERAKVKADAMNAGMLLAQTIQLLKDMGCTKEIMEGFLSKTLLIEEDQANLYAKIVDVKPPGMEGGGEGGFGGDMNQPPMEPIAGGEVAPDSTGNPDDEPEE